MLAGGRNLTLNSVAGNGPVGLCEVGHGEVNAGEIASGDRQIARLQSAGCNDDSVESLAQLLPRDVDADVGIRAETGSLGLHLGKSCVDRSLLQLEVRDAVPQESANTVVALINHNGVSGAGKLLGSGETGRSRTDDSNRFLGQSLWNVWRQSTVGHGVINDGNLDLLYGDSGLIDA
jgi:hypothetical protein